MSYSYQTSFNAAQNTLPKAQRKAAKLNNIAKIDRNQVGTPSYRPLNKIIGSGTVSPTPGHPWSL